MLNGNLYSKAKCIHELEKQCTAKKKSYNNNTDNNY